VRPGRVARDPVRVDAGLRERLAPVTQELHLVRSGRRPVEEVEEEEDRDVRGQLADRSGLARRQPDGGLRDLVACREHRLEPTALTRGATPAAERGEGAAAKLARDPGDRADAPPADEEEPAGVGPAHE